MVVTATTLTGTSVTSATPSSTFSRVGNSPRPMEPYTSRRTNAANFFSSSPEEAASAGLRRGRWSLFGSGCLGGLGLRSWSSDSMDESWSVNHVSGFPSDFWMFGRKEMEMVFFFFCRNRRR